MFEIIVTIVLHGNSTVYIVLAALAVPPPHASAAALHFDANNTSATVPPPAASVKIHVVIVNLFWYLDNCIVLVTLVYSSQANT